MEMSPSRPATTQTRRRRRSRGQAQVMPKKSPISPCPKVFFGTWRSATQRPSGLWLIRDSSIPSNCWGTISPAAAARCGRAFGVSQASCSYHPHQLARYGYVEDAGLGRDRREQLWRLTDRRLRLAPRTRPRPTRGTATRPPSGSPSGSSPPVGPRRTRRMATRSRSLNNASPTDHHRSRRHQRTVEPGSRALPRQGRRQRRPTSARAALCPVLPGGIPATRPRPRPRPGGQ